MKYVPLTKSKAGYGGVLVEAVAGHPIVRIYESEGTDVAAIVVVGDLTFTVVHNSKRVRSRCYVAKKGASQRDYQDAWDNGREEFGRRVQHGSGYVTVEVESREVDLVLAAGQRLAEVAGWLE